MAAAQRRAGLTGGEERKLAGTSDSRSGWGKLDQNEENGMKIAARYSSTCGILTGCWPRQEWHDVLRPKMVGFAVRICEHKLLRY